MLSLNSKNTFLPSLVNKPRIGFDADYYKLFFRNTDIRSKVSIEYILNTNKNTVNPGVVLYDLPEIDREYLLKYTVKPENSNLKEYSGEMNIFKNSINCKYFHYAGDLYESTHIDEYRGTLNNIVIPTKHNLTNTLSAEILSFPNVSSSTIQITTPQYMDTFNIKEDRITKFTILSTNFQPVEEQFKNLINLTTIEKLNTWLNIPTECFYNCSSFSFDDNFFKYTEVLGENSFYNVPIETFRFAGETVDNSGIENSTVFTSNSTFNGYDEKALYENSTDTSGNSMFVGVNDTAWEIEVADDSAIVVPVGRNTNGSGTEEIDGIQVDAYCHLLRCSDPNIIGFRFKTRQSSDESSNMLGCGVHIPQNIRDGYEQTDYITEVDGVKYFIVNSNLFYNDFTSDELAADTNILEISAFDRKGYKETVITKKIDCSAEPTFSSRLAFYTTVDNSTLTLDDDTFETNVPSKRIYLYADFENIPKLKFSIKDNGVNDSWDFLEVDTKTLNSTPNYYIKWIDLSDYLNIEAILQAQTDGLVSWPTYVDALSDFTIYIYNADKSGDIMTEGYAGNYVSRRLSLPQTSFEQ